MGKSLSTADDKDIIEHNNEDFNEKKQRVVNYKDQSEDSEESKAYTCSGSYGRAYGRHDSESAATLQMFTDDSLTALKKLRSMQTYEEEEDLETFEDDTDYTELYNRAQEKYVYFWKSHDIYSQWNTRYVFYVNGKKFNCAEQFMMYRKALLFGDDEIADEILWCKDSRKIEALARKVCGFNQDLWGQHCLHIAKEGNMAKFTQNKEFLADLLLTYPKVLVEASPYDRIWGIGYEDNSPGAWDESTWAGTNYLGYVLTEVRDDIMVERGMIDEEDRVRYVDKLLTDAGYDNITRTIEQAESVSHTDSEIKDNLSVKYTKQDKSYKKESTIQHGGQRSDEVEGTVENETYDIHKSKQNVSSPNHSATSDNDNQRYLPG